MTYFLGPISITVSRLEQRVVFHSKHSKNEQQIADWTSHSMIVYCHFHCLYIWNVEINTEIYIEAFAIIFT